MTYTRLFTHKPGYTLPMPDLADYMTTEEAAKLLGFNVKSVRNMVYSGNLECRKWGRSLLITRNSVKKYLEKTKGMSKNDPRRSNRTQQ